MCFRKIDRKKNISSVLNTLNTTVLATTLLISAVACLFYLYFSTVNIMTNTIKIEAKNAAERIEWVIKSYKNIIQGLGSIPELSSNMISTKAKELILDNKSREFSIGNCKIINRDGTSDMDSVYRGDREYFKRALEGNVFISDPLVSRIDGHVAILLSAPVWRNGIYNGTIDSVLRSDISPEVFNDILLDFDLSPNSNIYIITKERKIISSSNKNVKTLSYSTDALNISSKSKKLISNFEQKSVMGELNITNIFTNGSMHCFSSYTIEGTPGWTIIIDSPVSDYLASFWMAIVFITSISIVLIFISRHLIKRHSTLISEPIQHMADRLRQAAVGDFKSEVNYDNSLEEVKIIANATQSLANRMNNVLNGINSNSTQAELTRFIDFTDYIPVGENFEKVMHVHLCLFDSKMNRIIGSFDESSCDNHSAPVMVNNKTAGKYIMSPAEGCILSGEQIQLIVNCLALLVGKIIENILSREIRYKAWKMNEIINNEKFTNNSDEMSKDILEWTSEFIRTTTVTGNKEIKKAAEEFEKKILQFNSRIQENSEFARLTNFDTNINESDYELKYLIENIDIRISKEAENKDKIAVNSKEKPEEILFGDRKAIEKVIMRIILFLQSKNADSEINVLSSTAKETFGYTLQFKFRIEHHSMKKEELQSMKMLENRNKKRNGTTDSDELRLLAAYNLLWLMNGSVSLSVDEECCLELIVKIPQL